MQIHKDLMSTATSVAWVSQVFCSGHLINHFDPSFLFQHVEGFWTMSFVLYNSSNDRWHDHYHTNVSQDHSPSPDPVAQRFKDSTTFFFFHYKLHLFVFFSMQWSCPFFMYYFSGRYVPVYNYFPTFITVPLCHIYYPLH